MTIGSCDFPRVSSGILSQYTGRYVDDGIDWVVTLEGRQLMIQRTGREKAPPAGKP